ncbi:hypothetical protein JGS22_006440 [Streptomyces sp. P38-E01]|uniref:Uncharacterized protein n=1 Tax=Streptomyces tardus TaxID=2780544 RepID=A0A949JCE9_9ACTN|nr:hypothetical protein [Streptomyces tardus]MBU7597281.1 hypothetical protein [Streptomyces tardus]
MSRRHQEHSRFAEQQRQKNLAVEQRAEHQARDMHSMAAKGRGKTARATARRQGRD